MSRTVIISLSIVALFVIVPLTLYFVLPDPEPPADAPTAEESAHVRALIEGSEHELPHVSYTKVRTTDRRVVIVEARWTGEGAPDNKDKELWDLEADKIAQLISEEYLPSGWQVNVHLYRSRFLLMGLAARPSAEDGPEGWLRLSPED